MQPELLRKEARDAVVDGPDELTGFDNVSRLAQLLGHHLTVATAGELVDGRSPAELSPGPVAFCPGLPL